MKISFHLATIFRICLAICLTVSLFSIAGIVSAQTDNDQPPETPVKLVFVHHSTGENWLQDGYGNLGMVLAENNYFVSDTNYGWGRNGIGDRTDIVNWPEWFGDERDDEILNDLYHESEQNSYYTRYFDDPGGENTIIMFKSCFPNSDLEGNPDDEPQAGEYQYSVGNAKYIYNQLLEYFSTRPDKLFIVITAPPLSDATHAANARGFNNWLVNDWLDGYPGNNVAVFDFYNVLTGADHHHRFVDGYIEHTYVEGHNTLHYPSDDDHPSAAGSQKATEEFIPLLNVYYHRWAAGAQISPHVQDDDSEMGESVQEEDDTAPGHEEDMEEAPVMGNPEGVVDDFDGVTGFWNCYNGNDDISTIDMSLDSSSFHGGSNAMRMTFEFKDDGYVDCGRELEPAQDWTGSQGISFWVQSDQDISDVTLTVITSQTPFDQMFSVPATSGKWVQMYLAWEDFELAQWADVEGSQQLSLSDAMSIVFTVDSYDGLREGHLWIDDIELANSATGNTQIEQEVVNEPPAMQEAAEEEQQQTVDDDMDMGEEESSGQSAVRSICPFSSVLLPVGVAVFTLAYGRKKKYIQ